MKSFIEKVIVVESAFDLLFIDLVPEVLFE